MKKIVREVGRLYDWSNFWFAFTGMIILILQCNIEANGRHFAGDILKCISLMKIGCIFIHIIPKFVVKDPISNMAALVQIMALQWSGDKPLSEPMMA